MSGLDQDDRAHQHRHNRKRGDPRQQPHDQEAAADQFDEGDEPADGHRGGHAQTAEHLLPEHGRTHLGELLPAVGRNDHSEDDSQHHGNGQSQPVQRVSESACILDLQEGLAAPGPAGSALLLGVRAGRTGRAATGERGRGWG